MKRSVAILFFVLVSITIYAQGTWATKANVGGAAIAREYAMSFAINGKGYIFMGSMGASLKDVWEYDPVANTWTQKLDFPGAGRAQAVTFTIGNKGYMVCGIDVGSPSTVFSEVWEYDPSIDTWTKKANFPGTPRCASVGFSIGNKGYMGTGNVNPGVLNDFWEYDPSIDTWTQKPNFPGSARWGATGFAVNGKGYIGVGVKIPAPPVQSDFYEYDPATNTWKAIANFPGTSSTGYELTGFSICTRGYIATGWTAVQPFSNQCWEYNPTTNAWTQMANIPIARIRDNSFVINDKAYVGSGQTASTFGKELYEYTPPAGICTSLPPTAYFTPENINFCEGTCIGFQDSSINVPTTWNWQFPGGTPATSTSQNPSGICFSTAGTYSVTLIASNAGGSDTIEHVVTVKVCSTPPTALITKIDTAFCANFCVTPTDSSINNPTAWSWKFPGASPAASSSKNPGSICYATAGTYTMTLIASNPAGSDTMNKIINVKTIPAIKGSGNVSICIGSSATISVSGGTSYTWSPGNGITSTTSSSNTASPSSTQTYTITGTSNGCTDTALIKVTVNNLPTVNGTGAATICPGGQATLNASGAATYSWTPGSDLSSTTGSSVTADPTTTLTYTVTGTDANGCQSLDTVTVNVNAVQFLTSTGDTFIVEGGSAQLISSGGTNYTWTPANSLSCNTCANPVATPSVTTTYLVQSTNSSGCVDTDTITIMVEIICNNLYMPTAFSPNNDGVNDILYLRGNCVKDMFLQIYNRWGQKIFETNDPTNGWNGIYMELPVDAGVYMYYLVATDKTGDALNKKGSITLVR